jgi:hypothetical protein
LDFLYPWHPRSVVNSAFGWGFAALGSSRLVNCSFQADPKAPRREKSDVDL